MSEQPDALARIMAMKGVGQVQRVLNQAIYGNVDGPDVERTPVDDDLARAVDEESAGPVRPDEEPGT
ncbi:hypothetical protein [Streptomyces sp. NBC_01614]|uniref:hypothetical protein n=1 Tax=Streptomyces sp. NBC_01614 TaxID=2975897 RepID=UPI003868676E